MATKSKAAAKPAPAAKTAKKVTAKAPAAKAAVKAPAKAAAKTPAKVPAAKSVAAKTPPAKSAPAAKTPAKAAAPAAKGARAPAAKSAAEKPAGVAHAVPAASLPPPRPATRPGQAVSEQDLAVANEYLLNRRDSRSGEAVVVDGRRLPTEKQLLAMGEDDYMNVEQLAFFRHRLQEMERELLSNAGETTEHLRETVIVPDPADRATIEEEHALELRTRDRERKLLKKIQASLQQIEAGDYGYCEETGDPIGIPRLLARPTATLSLEAQQRREIKQKLFGD
jgi:DnaK suppressor protein